MSQINTNVDGITLKLTNLEKVLWPADNITKAELIQYYISVSEYMLPLVTDRPLSLIRYPDGIDGPKFYSKNAPDFTPEWINLFMKDDINYICPNKKADLVYLANLASLEIHAMNIHMQTPANPDTIIFDLDPSVNISFDTIKTTAVDLYNMLEDKGYHPHIKTSGSKGLHIYVPIFPMYSRIEVFETAKKLGQEFINHNGQCTLKLSKEKRQGKILIDIYRNHDSQTCVCPLSTRAKPGAPVSMPLSYDDLKDIHSSAQFNVRNASEYLINQKPWNDYNQKSTNIHDLQKDEQNADEVLLNYTTKRNFEKTTEPLPVKEAHTSINRFVIQLHDAQNLHFDLRIEENGVLKSWAIPKGMPLEANCKRLAIQTEDHPVKYLDFEGIIPKNEYGGGTMWIFDSGTYEISQKTDKSYKLRLKGQVFNGEYHLFQFKENQWLITLESEFKLPKVDSFDFMLADQALSVPFDSDYIYEVKWDGIRAKAVKMGATIEIYSRSGRNISTQFPEICDKLQDIDGEYFVIDGELVSLDDKGIPIFANIISRMHAKSITPSQHNASFYVFDILYLDGKDCRSLTLDKRKEWLDTILKPNAKIRISQSFNDGVALFEAAKANNMEGIMAKKINSTYQSARNSNWQKIKVRTVIDVKIVGYTQGKGDRSTLFGALHVASINDNTYLGKVGTGFDETKMKEIFSIISDKTIIPKPYTINIEEEYNTVWIDCDQQCEVQYASITPNGTLREPVFLRLKYTDE